MQRFQNSNKFIPQSILKGYTLAFNPPRNEQYFFMFNINHFDISNSIREFKYFGFRKRLGGKPSPFFLPNYRRIETFFNCCPNREIWGKLISSNFNIRPIANTDFVNFIKEIIL